MHIHTFLQTVISSVTRVVSYRTKHKSTSNSVLFVGWREAITHTALLRSGFTGSLYHTNWRCCSLDYDSEFRLVINFLFLVHLYIGIPYFCNKNGDASEQRTLSDKCGSYLTWSMYRPAATGGVEGNTSQIFCAPNFCVPKNCFKHIIKTKIFPP